MKKSTCPECGCFVSTENEYRAGSCCETFRQKLLGNFVFKLVPGRPESHFKKSYGKDYLDGTSSMRCPSCSTVNFVAGNWWLYNQSLIECHKCGSLAAPPHLKRKDILSGR